ncbi:hypothetical protein Tco_0657781 [Tanacetum coccineum]
MALPPSDQIHQYLRFEGLEYTDADITDFEDRLGRIYGREIHRVQVFDFGGLTNLMAEGLSGRILMEHRDAQGHSMFTSRAWRRLFEAESARQILDKGDLSAYWVGISSAGDFLGTTSSYTSIRYLRMFASGSKRGAMISGGQFVARLAEHFRMLIEERLQGLTMIVQDLPMIDMDELVSAVGALDVAEGAPDVDEGDQAVLAPIQAPQPPPTAGPARTTTQRIARLEEDVHGMRGALGEQREAGVRYTSYADFQIPYVRRTRRGTDDANTLAP